VAIKTVLRAWAAGGNASGAHDTSRIARDQSDPLQAFGAERPRGGGAGARRNAYLFWGGGAAVVLLSAALGGLVATWRRWSAGQRGATVDGRLRIEALPAGAEILVDGQPRGAGPLTLSLSGDHAVAIRSNEEPKPAGGAQMTVISDPPGARVHVDGVALGVTPLTVPATAPGTHRVTVANDAGSVDRTVTLAKDANASIVFALPKAAAPQEGWVAVSAPFEIQVSDGGEVIAVGRSMKLALSAGSHQLALASDAYQFHETRRVQTVAGRTVPLRVDAPRAAFSANARPWADVLIDGVPVGQTPISNLPVTVGPHNVVFRHPQLGERPQAIAVTLRGPNRFAVDFTK
jgi:hypothetical protein